MVSTRALRCVLPLDESVVCSESVHTLGMEESGVSVERKSSLGESEHNEPLTPCFL